MILTSSIPPPFASQPSMRSWPVPARLFFRFIFCYLLLSVVVVTGVVRLLPLIGPTLQSWIDLFWSFPVHWAAQHIFHLAGVAATEHPNDSRDTALAWITLAVLLVTALVASLVWSVLDRRRLEYRSASVWLRFVVRLAVIFLMFRYGLFKIFPLQMPPPSLAVLNEPVGSASPLALLWTLIGLHPAYEILCGALETLAAVLLIFRRTATLGAMLTAVLMTNVLLYNLFFDVPVKLVAINLLVLDLALLAPDLRALYDFYWHHRPSTLDSRWSPEFSQPRHRLAIRVLELAFAALVLFRLLPGDYGQWQMQQAALHHPSPLTGEWRIDSAILTVDGHPVARPVLTGDGQPMSVITFDPTGTAMLRSTDGRLWRGFAMTNQAKQTLTLVTTYADDAPTYRIRRPDAAHLVLVPVAPGIPTLSLTQLPLPADYPLLKRGLHWVNEWGYWM